MITPRRHWLIATLLALALVATWLRPLDTLAERNVEDGLKRALLAFAAARTLNAVLSTLKEASVSLQIGAGVSVKPGAVLEPLDEVVQQFSTLMFAATVSFAVQRLMIETLAAWPVCAVLSVLLLAWAWLAWRRRGVPPWLPRIAVALLILRLAAPVLAITSEAVHLALLDGPYQKHAAQLSALEAAEIKEAAGEGLVDRVKRLIAQGADIARQVESLKARAQDLVENMVRLAAVFVVQTLVLPLLYLWFLFSLHRMLTGARVRSVARALRGHGDDRAI